jgi:hypothetical protein
MFESFANSTRTTASRFYMMCTNHQIYSDRTKNKFNELKSKKVYFDFESINTATRIIDDTLPFMQCVNQVSVIFDHGCGINAHTLCNNLLIDPLKMDKEKYKLIVDAIMPDSDLKKCSSYSYIVYSKIFEESRLKEMK